MRQIKIIALVVVAVFLMSGLSIVLGIVALAGLSFISYLRGVAQVVTFLAISVWALVFGVRMLWRASYQVSG